MVLYTLVENSNKTDIFTPWVGVVINEVNIGPLPKWRLAVFETLKYGETKSEIKIRARQFSRWWR